MGSGFRGRLFRPAINVAKSRKAGALHSLLLAGRRREDNALDGMDAAGRYAAYSACRERETLRPQHVAAARARSPLTARELACIGQVVPATVTQLEYPELDQALLERLRRHAELGRDLGGRDLLVLRGPRRSR